MLVFSLGLVSVSCNTYIWTLKPPPPPSPTVEAVEEIVVFVVGPERLEDPNAPALLPALEKYLGEVDTYFEAIDELRD